MHNKGQNQLIKTDLGITQMAEVTDKVIKIGTVNGFHMPKKVEESMNMLRKIVKDIKRISKLIQIFLVVEVKDTLNDINRRLDTE